ncbi:14170_t:CDS:2 [Funneliformis caledonium]|uniref:14170_t:CDS:1 n=1 Tax=Funneliformis caledonium TaxID=1117310 RepID=A0A9N8ZHE2_9GLOM|nr:14170_t:CDS:2 [Funneliformis caledonium]
MTTFLINCLAIDDYSCEDVLEIRINGNETVENLVEIIKKSKLGFNGKLLKIDHLPEMLSGRVLSSNHLFPALASKDVLLKKSLCPVIKLSTIIAMGEIVNKSNKLQIRCIKDRQEFDSSSFAKFIKLAIAPCDITSRN